MLNSHEVESVAWLTRECMKSLPWHQAGTTYRGMYYRLHRWTRLEQHRETRPELFWWGL